jgi:hypothetical protein
MITSWVMVLFLYVSEHAVTIPNFSSEQTCVEELNRVIKKTSKLSSGVCVKVQ